MCDVCFEKGMLLQGTNIYTEDVGSNKWPFRLGFTIQPFIFQMQSNIFFLLTWKIAVLQLSAITEEKIASNDLSRSLVPSHPNISNLTDIAGHKCQMKDRLHVNPFLTSWIIIPDVLTKN